MYRAEKRYPVTKVQLLDSVQKYILDLGNKIRKTPLTEKRPGRHWYEKFRVRHPPITIMLPQHLSMARASPTEKRPKRMVFRNSSLLAVKRLR